MGSNRCLWGVVLVLGVLVGCGSTVAGTEGRDDASRTDAARDAATDATSDDRPIDERDASIDAEDPGDAAPSMDADDGSTVDVMPPIDRGVTDAPTDDGPRVDIGPTGCAAAVSLRDGEPLTDQHLDGPPQRVASCQGMGELMNRARWYRVMVPPGAVLEVTADDGSGFLIDTVLAAYTGCEAACLTRADSFEGRTPLLWVNHGEAAREVFVAVTSHTTVRSTLTVRARVRPAATNITCATATPLVDGVTLARQDLGLVDGVVRHACGTAEGFRAAARRYAISVPARSALDVEVRVDPTTSPFTLRVHRACDEALCRPTEAEIIDAPALTQRVRFTNPMDASVDASVSLWTDLSNLRPAVVDITARLSPLPGVMSP